MKVHVLGTGHADMFEDYNTCFVLENMEKYLLVDAGGGSRILRQLKLANIALNEIEYAFISHNHADHMLGFAWVLRYVMINKMKGSRTKPFTLYGREECIEAVKNIMVTTMGKSTCEKFFDKFIYFNPVKDGEKRKILGLDFTFFDTKAPDIDTKTSEIEQTAFYVKEKGFYFCGDVPLNERYFKKFSGAKWLCLEAFCLECERKGNELHLKKHKTVKEASEIAQILNAENLILWHSNDNHATKQQKEYINEAKSVYSGNVYVPKDLDTLEL